MKRTGLGGAGELITAFSEGLVQPAGVCAQCRPRQWLGSGDAVIAVASWRMVESTLPTMFSGPASTRRTPSFPMEAVMLPPAPTNIYTLPWTGSTWISPSGAGLGGLGGVFEIGSVA